MRIYYKFQPNMQITGFYTMFQCERQPGYAFKGETHDFWECVYVQDGKIRVTSDERIYNLKKGQIVFHKPDELHKYNVVGNEKANLFIFTYECFGKFSSFFENKVLELDRDQMQIIEDLFLYMKSIGIKLPLPDNCDVLKMLQSKPVEYQTIATYFHSLFLSLYHTSKSSKESNSESAKNFKHAIQYMRDNIDKNITIDELAEHCCISPTGIKNLFYKYSGLGVHKYFLKLKISTATQLLEKGKSVSDVAEILGFSSQAYFSAAYKRETGKNPSKV